MSRAVQELRQIPFAHLIGAPLKAAIEAQALAAQSTVDFIHKVGFKQPLNNDKDLIFDNTEADAEAARIYAESFGKDEGFYDFYRAMQSYDASFGKGEGRGDSSIILSTDNEYFRQFQGQP